MENSIFSSAIATSKLIKSQSQMEQFYKSLSVIIYQIKAVNLAVQMFEMIVGLEIAKLD